MVESWNSIKLCWHFNAMTIVHTFNLSQFFIRTSIHIPNTIGKYLDSFHLHQNKLSRECTTLNMLEKRFHLRIAPWGAHGMLCFLSNNEIGFQSSTYSFTRTIKMFLVHNTASISSVQPWYCNRISNYSFTWINRNIDIHSCIKMSQKWEYSGRFLLWFFLL